ncbi:MAG: hypothetical protein R2815_10630 [Flavobacteriales bacterium]|nr:hypothetical protein [Flavobacteriales bacterium]
MDKAPKDLPLSMVTLVFGVLSIPLAFARHLVSLAVVVGVLAILFGMWGTRARKRHMLRYTLPSIKRSRIGMGLAMAGTTCALVMWVLWATNALL